ncbi:MAG: DNA polymerase III subunit gamma/tau [Succinivibrio sp.]|jgi:DNA polymerase-3 subunit gamma/tau|nr:DNA polymerase III subunit gamma/tau [Succinivibrio sp.]
MEQQNEYQALARKYRPQGFDDVVGQKAVISALSNTLDSGRVHHAYLLTGTRGIGKTTIARIMAKCLECEHGMSSHPCGECETCREIAEGTFPDVIEIDAASQTKVDDTRQLLENTRYPPMRGRYKIYIIDEVHMLTASSFNALLKTLEEPPAYVKFILATTDPLKIPATVLSRCLKFQLMALTKDEIREQIEKIAGREGIPCESEAAALLAAAARGSMRDALSLCDQAAALGGGSIKRDSVLAMLGTAGDELTEKMLSMLCGSEVQLPALLDEVRRVSPNYRNMLDALVVTFHDLALFQFTGRQHLNLFSTPLSLLEKYGARFDPKALQLYYQIAIEGVSELSAAPDAAAVFDMTLLRLLAFTPEKKKIG